MYGCTVKLGEPFSGQVIKFLENTIETYRFDANVLWDENLKESYRYRVGRNGQCDLKFIKAAKGPMYYEEHLPIATDGE